MATTGNILVASSSGTSRKAGNNPPIVGLETPPKNPALDPRVPKWPPERGGKSAKSSVSPLYSSGSDNNPRVKTRIATKKAAPMYRGTI